MLLFEPNVAADVVVLVKLEDTPNKLPEDCVGVALKAEALADGAAAPKLKPVLGAEVTILLGADMIADAVSPKLKPELVLDATDGRLNVEVAGCAPNENPVENATLEDATVDDEHEVGPVEAAKTLFPLLAVEIPVDAVDDPKLNPVLEANSLELLPPKLKLGGTVEEVADIKPVPVVEGSTLELKLFAGALAIEVTAPGFALEGRKLKLVVAADTVEVVLFEAIVLQNDNPPGLLVLEEDAGPKLNVGLVSIFSVAGAEFPLKLNGFVSKFLEAVVDIADKKFGAEVEVTELDVKIFCELLRGKLEFEEVPTPENGCLVELESISGSADAVFSLIPLNENAGVTLLESLVLAEALMEVLRPTLRTGLVSVILTID